MKKTVIKKLSFVFALVMLVMSFPTAALAVDTSKELKPVYDVAILNATPVISRADDGFYEVTLSDTKTVSETRNETIMESSQLKFIGLSLDEAKAVSKNINAAKGGGTLYDDGWFFGSSCYIYINVNFSTKSDTSFRTLCRINTVDIRCQTNSGTTITQKTLNTVCHGVSEEGFAHDAYETINVLAMPNPYTYTGMSANPYIYNTGILLGASLTVTATRSSGDSATSAVVANVFNNA